MAIQLNDRRSAHSAKRGQSSTVCRRGKRGFTIVEISVSMVLIALITAAFIATCTVSANLQKRASNAAQACTAASEFVAAYGRAEGGTAPTFYDDYLAEVTFSLGLPASSSDNGWQSDGAGGWMLTYGDSSFQAQVNADGSVSYKYSTPQVRVEATAEFGGGITAKGYVNGYTSAVCSYTGGEVRA